MPLRCITLSVVCFGCLCGQAIPLEVDKAQSEISVIARVAGLFTFKGILKDFQHDIRLESDSSTIQSAKIVFKVEDLDTGIEGRNRDMAQWLGAEQNPSIECRFDTFKQVDHQYTAYGTLSMNGIEHPIFMPFTMHFVDDTMHIDGDCQIDYRNWELPDIRIFIFKVKPNLRIRIRLQGELDTEDREGTQDVTQGIHHIKDALAEST